MKRIARFAFVAALATLVSLPAYATCSAPASPGAVICFPSTNATSTYPMSIEGAATGKNGLPIV